MDDRYEYGTLQLISPETRTEPVIQPWGLCLHTHGFNATSQAIGNYFGKKEVLVESHGSNAQDGKIYQFQFFDRQADAQAGGNGFTVPGRSGLHGMVSMESEDGGDSAHRPWSQAQVASFGLLVARQHDRYGLELAPATAMYQNRVYYHSQFSALNPNGHACPGPIRQRQIQDVINAAAWFLSLKEPKATDIVDEFTSQPGTPQIGHWKLQRDGGVITVSGRFLGSYPGLGPAATQGGARTFGRFEARADGGYNLISASNERYQFPA
jgi:hypothetical protein